ncbi:MAG: radical SAM protein, partial [Candidatus Caldatribacteriaceae bacterium]
IPSLDAGRENTFERINRPHPFVDFGRYVDGLLNLRKRFRGDIWLEVFIVENLNDTPQEIEALRRIIERMLPNEVHVNSLDRKPAEEWVRAPSLEKLQRIAHILGGKVITSLSTALSLSRL